MIAALAALLAGAAAATAPVRQATPAFVVTQPIPAPRPERLRAVQNGIYTLLYDTQVLARGAGRLTYRRQVDKVTDRNGLEQASKTSIDFDPYRETLAINAIRIIRGGQVIDALPTATIDTIRRESELDDDVWTGVMTSVIQVRDLRVGDLIDISWTWEDRGVDWPGQLFDSFDLGWSVPVGVAHARLVKETPGRLFVRARGDAPAPVVRREGAATVYEWRRIDPEPVDDEDDHPTWLRPWARAEVSTMASWGDVVRWALPFYAAPGVLPPDLAAKVAAIAARTPDPARRTVAAMRLVQDQTRYNSLSMGAGSYRPRQVAEVWRSGFGDCKDKAQLLAVILRRLGIEAWPALADSDKGGGLADTLPAPTAFDHVVVLARVAGREHWLDATKSLQGGTLEQLADLPYRWALPIRPGQNKLAAIPWRPSPTPTQEAVQTYRVTPDGLRFDIVTTYRQDEADIFRQRLTSTSLAGLEKEYRDYYRGRYPGAESVAALRVADNRDANVITVREAYRLDKAALGEDELGIRFPLEASTFSGLYKRPEAGVRHSPLAVQFPINRLEKMVVIAPGVRLPVPQADHIDGPAFTYDARAHRDGDALVIEAHLVGKRAELAPADVADYRDDAKALSDASYWSVNLSGDPPPRLAGLFGLLILSGAVLGGIGLWRAWRRGGTHQADEALYPVPVAKLLLLSLSTLGLYAAYWQYRCWKQVRHADGMAILPFWRAFLGMFWLWPLFVRANRDARPPVARGWGLVAAIGYPLWNVAAGVAARVWPEPGMMLAGLPGLVFLVPVALAVNRSNDGATLYRHGHFSLFALLAVLNGLGIEGMMIYLAS